MREAGEKKGKRGREGGEEGKRQRRGEGRGGGEASFTASSSHARHIPKTQDSHQGGSRQPDPAKIKLHKVQNRQMPRVQE